jgi:hypothetical protein
LTYRSGIIQTGCAVKRKNYGRVRHPPIVQVREQKTRKGGPPAGPNHNYEGSKKQLCDQESDKAGWEDFLPFGSTLLGGDYRPNTTSVGVGLIVADQARDYVANSPQALRAVRSSTGVPMMATSRFLTYLGWAITAYNVYHALDTVQKTYLACMAS